MGMDFSYLLYFKKQNLWKALLAVVDISEAYGESTRVIFPDHEMIIPLGTWVHKNGVLNSVDDELDFNGSLFFEEDDAIREYLQRHNTPDGARSINGIKKVPIGMVYLTIYNQNAAWYRQGDYDGLIAFNFGTPGTTMSLLFDDSPSIRQTFIELLERLPGVCGVFNREESGEVFWYEGRAVSERIDDPFMPPGEIKTLLGL